MLASWLISIGLGLALFVVSYSRQSIRPRTYLLLITVGVAVVGYSVIISVVQGYEYLRVLFLEDYPQGGRSIVLAYGLLTYAVFRGTLDLSRFWRGRND